MAIQRQNPQFDPQRIVQPTTVPIDTYFRPMLRQPEQPKILQVAAALADISPQLGRLASDAMAANIEAQKEYGAYEANSEKDSEVLRRKAAEAIENSGGIAPWRYQSFLEAYGQRLVRDKYRNELYNNLDDLSNPYNEDGTVRPPTYVAEQMAKLYEAANVPTNSYFMNKGAAAARAEADNSFYDRLMGARRQKVMDASRDTLADGIQFSIETNPDLSSLFGKTGALKVLSDRYYRDGGQDGDEIVANGVLNAAKGLASEGDYDRALELLRYPIEEKIGDRTLGARHRARLQETYDLIERKGREAELDDGRNRESRKQVAGIAVEDKLIAEFQGMKKNTRFLSLNMSEVMELVDKNMAGVNMDEDIKVGVRGRLIDWARNYVDALNKPEPRDPRQENISFDQASRNAQTMEPGAYRDYLSGMLANELITVAQYTQLVAQNRSFFSLSDGDRQQMNLRLATITGTSWTGLGDSQIARDANAELSSIGNKAASDTMAKFFAEVNSPEFKQKYPDEAQQAMARDQAMARIVGETQTSLLTQHRAKIEQANLAASFDATVGQDIKAEASTFAESVMADIPGILSDASGNTKGYFASGLGRRISAILYERVRSEWGTILSDNGQPPLSLEQRKRALYERLPDIADRLHIELTTSPEKLGLPSNYTTVLRGATAPVSAAEAAAPNGKPLPISKGITEFRAPGATYFGTAPGATYSAEGNISWPSEGNLVKAASDAGQLAQEAATNPTARTKHNALKQTISDNADSVIREIQSTTTKSIPYRMLSGNLRPVKNIPDVPLYEIREDGLYVLMDMNGNRSLSQFMTNRYWAAKALSGYSADEISSGKTKEGISLTPDRFDSAEYLYFKSAEDFSKAVEEYTSSSGKTGVIAEVMLPASKKSFADFRAEQLELLRDRKPLP